MRADLDVDRNYYQSFAAQRNHQGTSSTTISSPSVSTMCVAKRDNDEAGADEEGRLCTREWP
jgi:hypothetical protein